MQFGVGLEGFRGTPWIALQEMDVDAAEVVGVGGWGLGQFLSVAGKAQTPTTVRCIALEIVVLHVR
jgi:hypothetical protein